jgi:sterol desaturase/sphingolipid hydroxylase (fatty acid hydroxylase superfamily)
MKIVNPFDNIHLSEKYAKWTMLSVYIAIIVFCLGNAVALTDFAIIGLPAKEFEDTNSFFGNNSNNYTAFYVIMAVVFIVRLYITILDYQNYIKRDNNKISANYMYWIASGWFLYTISFIIFAGIIAGFLYLFLDVNIKDLFYTIYSESQQLKDIYYTIPNLIQLPGYIAAIIILGIYSLLKYAYHYLCHVSRLFWLLSHRSHHVTTALTSVAGFGADHDLFLQWIFRIATILVMLIVSKLITQESMVIYIFAYFTLWIISEQFNHNSTYYQAVRKNRFLNFYCKIMGNGPYHNVHHSSQIEHQMANLGGVSGIWDILFGTIVEPPEIEPPYGLTYQPEIHLSATRLVYGGLMQIGYELKHNKDFSTRFKIIFGEIFYKPPITKDFLIIEDGKQNVLMHQINY